MKQKVQGLMQKISYVEQDMELQKQILVTIPSKEKKDIEEVISNIAALKEKLEQLKLEIKEVDPEEYEKMMQMEKASVKFRECAEGKDFEFVKTFGKDGDLSVSFTDGSKISCLVAAKDKENNFLILSMDGKVLEVSDEEVEGVTGGEFQE